MSAPIRRRMSSRPVRVGFTPTPHYAQRRAAGDQARHDEECRRREIAGHIDARAREVRRSGNGDRRILAADGNTEGRQHPFRVIARGLGFDDAGRAIGIKAREQDRGLHLRARHVEFVAGPAQGLPARDRDRRSPVVGPDIRPHATQRRRDALHRPLHQRRVADQDRIERLPGEQACEQPHGRTRIAEIERVRGRPQSLRDRVPG